MPTRWLERDSALSRLGPRPDRGKFFFTKHTFFNVRKYSYNEQKELAKKVHKTVLANYLYMYSDWLQCDKRDNFQALYSFSARFHRRHPPHTLTRRSRLEEEAPSVDS